MPSNNSEVTLLPNEFVANGKICHVSAIETDLGFCDNDVDIVDVLVGYITDDANVQKTIRDLVLSRIEQITK